VACSSVVELFASQVLCEFNQFVLSKMEQGTIKRLTDRGFGFISREGSDKDLFFHAKELQDAQFNDLKEGDKVQFEVSESQKGPCAINVSRI